MANRVVFQDTFHCIRIVSLVSGLKCREDLKYIGHCTVIRSLDAFYSLKNVLYLNFKILVQ